MKRQTRQRQAIQQVIRQAVRPLSPQEVWTAARQNVQGLGIATVYRTISALVREGELVSVEIPRQTPRYEQAGLKHHHHFCCDDCGKVFELKGCALSPSVRAPRGFILKRHDITLYGQCTGCRTSRA